MRSPLCLAVSTAAAGAMLFAAWLAAPQTSYASARIPPAAAAGRLGATGIAPGPVLRPVSRPHPNLPLRSLVTLPPRPATTPSSVPPTPAPSTTTTTRTPVTTTTSPPPPTEAGGSGLGISDGSLVLDGRPYRPVGLDAYELATDWGVNAGCGGMLTDEQMSSFFAGLPPHALVRFWAFEGGLAINVHTGSIDWSPLDRVFAAAAAHGDLLIPSLTDQAGTCDGQNFKQLGWYEGGYALPAGTNAAGQPLPLSYLDYVEAIVTRYSASPALGFWELVNEPEASTCAPGLTGTSCEGHQSCPDESAAAHALRSFYDTVGGLVHRIAPGALVESGFLGGGQCGTAGSDYQYVAASPGIDVLSYHDYYGPSATVGGDQWNGIAVRAQQARALGKPLVAGEVGVLAGNGGTCPSPAQRASDYAERIAAQSRLGVQAFLFWSWVPSPSGAQCTYDVLNGDPAMSLVGQFTPGSA